LDLPEVFPRSKHIRVNKDDNGAKDSYDVNMTCLDMLGIGADQKESIHNGYDYHSTALDKNWLRATEPCSSNDSECRSKPKSDDLGYSRVAPRPKRKHANYNSAMSPVAESTLFQHDQNHHIINEVSRSSIPNVPVPVRNSERHPASDILRPAKNGPLPNGQAKLNRVHSPPTCAHYCGLKTDNDDDEGNVSSDDANDVELALLPMTHVIHPSSVDSSIIV